MSRKLSAALASAAILVSGMVATAAPAAADTITCRTSVGARTIDGDVNVPKGARCNLTGTKVKGNVFVRSGATLVADKAWIDGNVQAKYHRNVVVRNSSTVKGDVQLTSGRYSTITRSRIDGNIQSKHNRARQYATHNRVDGDIQYFSNTTGRATISYNRVEGNLQCKSNTPRPTGTGNKVEGDKEGQCRRF